MSKKNKESNMNILQKIMEEKGTPSLKAIAGAFNLPAVRLYSVAKTPKEGEMYDAKVYNWDAIERFIQRRLGQAEAPASLEDTVDAALIIDQELKAADGRRAVNKGGSYGKKIEVDGVLVAARRFTNHELDEENGISPLVVFKKNPDVYKIVYQTKSHTVLVPVSDMDRTIASQDVMVRSNSMMNMLGMAAMSTAQGIEERFSGAYLTKHPEYAKKPITATPADGAPEETNAEPATDGTAE